MTILADGGVCTALMSLGGKVWPDDLKLSQIFSAGYHLRKKFAIISLFFTAPILFLLLHLHDADLITSTLIFLALIPSFLSSLTTNFLEIIPKLNQNIVTLQKIQIQVVIIRLIFLFFICFFIPLAFLVILCSGLAQSSGILKLKKSSPVFRRLYQKPNTDITKDIILYVKKILPGSLYYCFSGQITIWIISFFGSITSIAQIGGLTRISSIVAIIGGVFSVLIIPRFARIQKNNLYILKRFLFIQSLLILILSSLVFLIWLFSNQVLWILGPIFFESDKELMLVLIGSCFSLLGSVTHQLLSSIGNILSPFIFISISIIIQIFLAIFFDLSKIDNVLIFGIIVPFLLYLVRFIYFLIKSNFRNLASN